MRFRRYGYGPGGPGGMFAPGGGGAPATYTTGGGDGGDIVPPGGFVVKNGTISPINNGNPITVTGNNTAVLPGQMFVSPSNKKGSKGAKVQSILDQSGAGGVKGSTTGGSPTVTATVEPDKVAVVKDVMPSSELAPGADAGLINRGDPYKPDVEPLSTETQGVMPDPNPVIGVPEGWWSRFKPYLPLAGVGVAGLGVLIAVLSTRE